MADEQASEQETSADDGQHLPAVITAAPGPSEWTQLRHQAEELSKSNLVPSALRGKPADLMIVFLTGRELQIPPMMAMNKIHVIEGKPTMSAELMMSLVLRAGHQIEVATQTIEKCVVRAKRSSSDSWSTFEFTMEDAKRAKLAGKATWQQYPKAMLTARAITIACRATFPDVLMGVSYAPEELGAQVDPITGEVERDPDVERITAEEANRYRFRILQLDEKWQAELRDEMREKGWILGRGRKENGEFEEGWLRESARHAFEESLGMAEQFGTARDLGGARPDHQAASEDDVAEGQVFTLEDDGDDDGRDDDGIEEAEVVHDGGGDEPGHPSLPGGPEPPAAADGAPQVPADADARGSAPAEAAADVPPPAGPPMSTRSQWSRLGAACSNVGLDDDARHDVVAAVSYQRVRSVKDLTKTEATWAISAVREIGNGHVRLGDYEPPDGEPFTTLLAADEAGVKFIEQMDHTLSSAPVPEPPA